MLSLIELTNNFMLDFIHEAVVIVNVKNRVFVFFVYKVFNIFEI